ncbi:hypothetical protein BRAS3843_190067 [Bradyrhizobium sp. STM 3843]|nr:hypothetical protein BRAS3843_190067 [Bradyrhizobium sp. STM 3843]
MYKLVARAIISPCFDDLSTILTIQLQVACVYFVIGSSWIMQIDLQAILLSMRQLNDDGTNVGREMMWTRAETKHWRTHAGV